MKKFIEELKKIFPYNKSVAIELILALTFSHELPGNSVVLLTESSFFQRKYSSLYLMLNNYFCARNTKSDQRITLRRQERKKIIKYITSLYSKGCNRNVYALDITNHSENYPKIHTAAPDIEIILSIASSEGLYSSKNRSTLYLDSRALMPCRI